MTSINANDAGAVSPSEDLTTAGIVQAMTAQNQLLLAVNAGVERNDKSLNKLTKEVQELRKQVAQQQQLQQALAAGQVPQVPLYTPTTPQVPRVAPPTLPTPQLQQQPPAQAIKKTQPPKPVPQPPAAPTAPASTSSAAAATISGCGDAFRMKAGEWKCPGCYVRNKPEHSVCPCCGTQPDGTEGKKDIFGARKPTASITPQTTTTYNFGLSAASTATVNDVAAATVTTPSILQSSTNVSSTAAASFGLSTTVVPAKPTFVAGTTPSAPSSTGAESKPTFAIASILQSFTNVSSNAAAPSFGLSTTVVPAKPTFVAGTNPSAPSSTGAESKPTFAIAKGTQAAAVATTVTTPSILQNITNVSSTAAASSFGFSTTVVPAKPTFVAGTTPSAPSSTGAKSKPRFAIAKGTQSAAATTTVASGTKRSFSFGLSTSAASSTPTFSAPAASGTNPSFSFGLSTSTASSSFDHPLVRMKRLCEQTLRKSADNDNHPKK